MNNLSIFAYLILLLMICIIINKIVKKFNVPLIEGMSQMETYISKKDNQIYDDFYSNIYDDLFFKQFSYRYEIGKIITETTPEKNSFILEIGCKTGNTIGILNNKGYTNAVGIDQSKSMIKKANIKFPNASFEVGSPINSMLYEPETYSHIMLLNLSFYHFKNHYELLTNCYNWLKPGGYMIINLVNKNKFNPTPPVTNPLFIISPQRFSKKQITKGVATFNNFSYESNFSILENDISTYKEKFVNKKTKNVRENELELYMPSMETTIKNCLEIGFILLSKIDMVKAQREYQYIYIFYKPN